MKVTLFLSGCPYGNIATDCENKLSLSDGPQDFCSDGHYAKVCCKTCLDLTHSSTGNLDNGSSVARSFITLKDVQCTGLFKSNGTLNFTNRIKTINHIDLILLGIHIHA